MRFVLVTACVLALMACGDNPPVNYPQVPQWDVNRLILGPGDKIELTIFYGSKDSKSTYTLDASGQMDVQFIGNVAAGGKGTREVQEEIKNRLADGYLNSPVVSLTVVEINSLKCSVFGQVAHSGTIKFTPGMTIVEAIAQSGGFSPLARKNLVRVTRTINSKKELYEIPVEMIAEGKRPNFGMAPGDEVFVPERAW
ncbi:MAG: polysaccharide biosynthesis/export family protein [Kofleriaceae bacterium]